MVIKFVQVGNGKMNTDTDAIGVITFPWTHALISDQIYEGLISSCNQSNADASFCDDGLVYAEMGNINPYSIYAPLCGASKLTKVCKEQASRISDFAYSNFTKFRKLH